MGERAYNRKRKLRVDHPITVDTICVANQDLLTLIIDTSKTMQAFGLPSLDFISEVLSSKTQHQQLTIIIQALQSIQHRIYETATSTETSRQEDMSLEIGTVAYKDGKE